MLQQISAPLTQHAVAALLFCAFSILSFTMTHMGKATFDPAERRPCCIFVAHEVDDD